MTHRSDHSPPPQTLSDLSQTIAELSDQIEVLRTVLDEIREELSWANRNSGDPSSRISPIVLTSMPVDPTTKDWKLNRQSAESMSLEDETTERPSQQMLFG